jgi:hypothetical protein
MKSSPCTAVNGSASRSHILQDRFTALKRNLQAARFILLDALSLQRNAVVFPVGNAVYLTGVSGGVNQFDRDTDLAGRLFR